MFLWAVILQNYFGKRSSGLGRPRMWWENVIKKGIELLGDGSIWRLLVMDREGWRLRCEMDGLKCLINSKKKKFMRTQNYV